MGRSAKFLKRVPKKNKSSATSTSSGTSQQQQVADSKKKAGLKSKATSAKSEGRKPGEPVLGGADYVSLMMGGRRKAREEAKKLPPPS
ncbi:hypothetical protein BDZ89DRAFT_342295 [Hymenopellis radicata]|nr:hypothetical protein BDZ89DRAFT_342295 [Hymenopellis radicata]